MTAPDSLSRFEDELRRKAERGRRRRRVILSILALLALAPAGLFLQRLFLPHLFDESFELPDEEKAAARAAVAKAREVAAEQIRRSTAALSEAHGTLGPDDDQPCSYQLPTLAQDDPANARFSFPARIVKKEDLASLQLSHGLKVEADAVERDIDETFYSQRRLDGLREDIRALEGARPSRPYQVVMVEVMRAAPSAPVTGATFEPGLVVGRAYLIELASARVACAADVIATNSEEVNFQYSVRGISSNEHTAAVGALARDLEIQVLRSISEQMRAAKPQDMSIDRLAEIARLLLEAEKTQAAEVPPQATAVDDAPVEPIAAEP